MQQKAKPSVCVLLWRNSLVDIIPQLWKVRLCILYLHFQWEEEPETAAIPGTIYRGLCSRKLVYPHTHCLFIITQLSVCYCLGNCGHQQTQQNNNAQGTILCTGPWEGPVEFLWSVSFWLFPIDAGPAIKCLECLVGTKWVGHRAIMLLSSMRPAVLWTDFQVPRGITNGLRVQIHGIFTVNGAFTSLFSSGFHGNPGGQEDKHDWQHFTNGT